MAERGDKDADSTVRPWGIWEWLRWGVEKCALPIALVAGPAVFQYMAGLNADERNAAELAQRQSEQKFQLYTNLLTKREEADTAARLSLLHELIGAFWDPKTADLDKKLVELELLALNFHDAINLNPMFWDLDRVIGQSQGGARREALLAQLDRIASGVKERQVELLEAGGLTLGSFTVDLEGVYVERAGANELKPAWKKEITVSRFNEAGKQDDRQRCTFYLEVSQNDPQRRRVRVELKDQGCLQRRVSFWVDLYDFPLTTYSRISPSERMAIVLEHYDKPGATATLRFVYFPSTRSASKDKPYVEDLLNRLNTIELPASAASSASAVR